MREIGDLDEKKLWTMCFPYCAQYFALEGVYNLPSQDELLRVAQLGGRALDERDVAVLRVELACAALWPLAKDEFSSDLFPHLLACATDILRAMDFGDQAEPDIAALVDELAAALDELEDFLHREQVESLPQAAAPGGIE